MQQSAIDMVHGKVRGSVQIGIVYGIVYEVRGMNTGRAVELHYSFVNFAENCNKFQLRRRLCRQLYRIDAKLRPKAKNWPISVALRDVGCNHDSQVTVLRQLFDDIQHRLEVNPRT